MNDSLNNNHWILIQSKIFPDRLLAIWRDTTLNYSSFNFMCRQAASYFSKLGINKNDNVALWLSHSIDFWISVNALWLIGAVPVPINTRITQEELEFQLELSEVKHIIFNIDINLNSSLLNKNHFQNLSSIQYQASSIQHPVSSIQYPASNIQSEVTEFPFLATEFSPDTNALIMFTSGSSGKPKAVVHTFSSLYNSVLSMKSRFELSQNDLWLTSLPFYHIGGFMILVRSLLTGSCTAFPDVLSSERIREAIINYDPTYLSLVSTTMQQFIIENVTPNPNLKYVFLGGGYLSDQLTSNAINLGWPIVKVYGSTETCSMVTSLSAEDNSSGKSSVGKVLDTERIKIEIKNKSKSKIKSASDDLAEMETGENIGEILVSSESLFKEYYNDYGLTKSKLHDGFYSTGDYGWLDDEGYLYIDSRREDIIISGGENVSALEVENAIRSIKEVIDVHVFGIKDNLWGERVCCALISKLNQQQLIEILRTKLAGYKIPKDFYFVQNIPRTELGKVRKSELLKLLNLG